MREVIKNTIIYVRVSHESQVDGYSLDDQEDRCRKEAEKQDYKVLKVYREEGVSAKTLDRPQLEELMQFVAKHHKEVQAIFFYHSSRLSRNTLDFLTLRAFFSKYGVSLNSLTEPITGDSPETKFLSTILSAANQLDNEIKGRTVKNSMKKRFLEGHAISHVPLGYMLEKVDKHPLVLKDPKYWDLISEWWYEVDRLQLSILHATKWLSKKTGKEYQRSTVSHMLNNKFYCGYITSPTYGEVKGKHDAMIDEALFYRVRASIEGRRLAKVTVKKHNDDFPVKGLLSCLYCGKPQTAAWSKGKQGRFGYYFCHRGCKRINLPKKVEDAYLAYLKTVKATEEEATYFCELLEEEYKTEYGTLKNTAQWVDDEIKKLEGVLVKLEEKHLEGVYSDEDYIRIRDGVKIKIASQKSLLAEKKIDTVNIEAMKATLKYYLMHLDQYFINADPESRYQIGVRINPKGFTYEGGEVRTPELGFCFAYVRSVSNSSASGVQHSTPYRIRTDDIHAENVMS